MATGMEDNSNAAGMRAPVTRRSALRRPGTSRARPAGMALGGLVQGEIIPRLLMAHRSDCPHRAQWPEAAPDCPISCEEAARFAILPLELEAAELLDEAERYLRRGVSVERLFIDLLAPAARRLGECWEEDACDFVDVTMGLWRLQEVMRELALRHMPRPAPHAVVRSALFAPMPGDQHSFGALMVEEVFARAGWQTEALFEPKRHEMLAVIGERAFDLVGLTVSSDCPSGQLADLIAAIRSVSRNPETRVIVGGRLLNSDPGLALAVGADGTAPDAESALALAERVVAAGRVPVA